MIDLKTLLKGKIIEEGTVEERITAVEYISTTKEELIELIMNLSEYKDISLVGYYDEEHKEAEYFYAVQHISWMDCDLILLGGYGQQTFSEDITIYNLIEKREGITELVNKWWNYESLGENIWIEISQNQ